jgi:hypothetical protein
MPRIVIQLFEKISAAILTSLPVTIAMAIPITSLWGDLVKLTR